jgi:Cu/Ag efflux protein CusF
MVRWFCAAAVVLLSFTAGCGKPATPPGPVQHYKMTGVVLRVDEKTKVATIRHETIHDEAGKVWMEAMTMDFPVRDANELAKLKPDMPVHARVNQTPGDFDFWIDEIEPQQTK